MCLITEFFSGQKEEREEQQTSDNIQLVFKLQIFFAFTPGGKCEAFHSQKKKKSKSIRMCF